MPDVVLQNCRFSYLNVFTPSTPRGATVPKYSVSILIPKEDAGQITMINQMIDAAIQDGVAKNKFTIDQTQKKSFRRPLRDGDEEAESGDRGPEYRGFVFLNANNADRPGVVDENRQPIVDSSTFYSGCWGHVHVSFFPYNNVSLGVGVGLNHIMKVREDERLDGRVSVDDAFSKFGAENPGTGITGTGGPDDDDIPF